MSRNQRFLGAASMLAIAFVALGFVTSPGDAMASPLEAEPAVVESVTLRDIAAQPYSSFNDVLWTYRSFTGIAGGTMLQDYIYAKEYRQLRYNSYYVQKPSVITGSQSIGFDTGRRDIIGPYGYGNGTVEYWQCKYEVH